MTPVDRTHILTRTMSVATLRDVMAQAGFDLTSEFSVSDGPEPDRIIWTGPQGTVTYIKDLVSANLFLISGPDAALPALDFATPQDARRLMSRDDTDAVLAGLQIAMALGDTTLARWIIPHMQNEDPIIATAANEAFEAIGESLGNNIDPGAALFSVAGWRQEKLQLLRWMATDPIGDPALLTPLLAKALADEDWEIAVTAILTAARLNCSDVIGDITRAKLPESRRDGLSNDETRLVLALRDAALHHLGAGNAPRLPDGVLEAVRGDAAGLPARFAAVFHALAQPLPDHAPQPVPHPDIVRTQTGPTLADGTLLIWVPPVPHWTGEELIEVAQANPLRRLTPQKGFFINAEPLAAMSYAAADHAAQSLDARLDLKAALPTSDQWEMAARGPDGRRFLWGMNLRCDPGADLSVWGMAGVMKSGPEWISGGYDGDTALATGGKKSPILATRQSIDAHKERCARVVFTL